MSPLTAVYLVAGEGGRQYCTLDDSKRLFTSFKMAFQKCFPSKIKYYVNLESCDVRQKFIVNDPLCEWKVGSPPTVDFAESGQGEPRESVCFFVFVL